MRGWSCAPCGTARPTTPTAWKRWKRGWTFCTGSKKSTAAVWKRCWSTLKKAREELDRIAGSEERRKHALEEQQRLQGELYRACAKLSEARRRAAAVLQEALVKELAELGMPGAQFAFSFEQPPEEGAARMSAKGFDRVQMALFGQPG